MRLRPSATAADGNREACLGVRYYYSFHGIRCMRPPPPPFQPRMGYHDHLRGLLDPNLSPQIFRELKILPNPPIPYSDIPTIHEEAANITSSNML